MTEHAFLCVFANEISAFQELSSQLSIRWYKSSSFEIASFLAILFQRRISTSLACHFSFDSFVSKLSMKTIVCLLLVLSIALAKPSVDCESKPFSEYVVFSRKSPLLRRSASLSLPSVATPIVTPTSISIPESMIWSPEWPLRRPLDRPAALPPPSTTSACGMSLRRVSEHS